MIGLKVKFKEYPGTVNGGVDIAIRVEITTDDKQVIQDNDRLRQEVNTAFIAWMEKLGVEGATEDGCDDDIYLSGDRTFVYTRHDSHCYEFSIAVPVSQFNDDILELASQTEMWWQNLKTGECKLKADMYVEGNAD